MRIRHDNIESLSDQELMEYALNGDPRGHNPIIEKMCSRIQLTRDYVPQHGDHPRMIAIWEIAQRFAGRRRALFLKPADIWNELPDIRKASKEHFVTIFLDGQNEEVRREIISIGTVDQSITHPRDVFFPAVKHMASSVILCHNHPSGNLQPSDMDIETTKRLVKAGRVLGIEVLDHVIITKTAFNSMKEKGMI